MEARKVTTPDLKPCPFCGGEVTIALTGSQLYNWLFVTRGHSATKKNCKCRLFMESERYSIEDGFPEETYKKVKSDLVSAWNRRVNDG